MENGEIACVFLNSALVFYVGLGVVCVYQPLCAESENLLNLPHLLICLLDRSSPRFLLCLLMIFFRDPSSSSLLPPQTLLINSPPSYLTSDPSPQMRVQMEGNIIWALTWGFFEVR